MNLIEQAQIHGLKHLKSKERCQWALSFIVFVVCSIIVLWIWLERYLENPTYIVQLDSRPIEQSFPAVVVCPEIVFPSHKIETFIKKLNYPSALNETYMRNVIPQLAAFFSPDVQYQLTDLENIQHILDYNDVDIESAGLNLTESCEETITRCRWRGRLVNCANIFEMTLTAYGFCCVFNGRSLKRELKDLHVQRKPESYRLYGYSGYSHGLMLVINQSQATPFNVDTSYKWLSLHDSQRYVDLLANGTPITPGTELFAGYSTTGLRVDEEAVNLNQELRRCRMSYEALKYFPVYHKKYCLMEREMQQTFERCGCLKIGHLSLSGVPVCRAQNLQCVRRNTVSFSNYDYDCPITCDVELEHLTIATYDLEPSSYPSDSFYNNLDFNKVSVVRAYMLDRNRKIFSRRPYFTKFELFAQLGGIFNIFFGCSVLSILELVLITWRGFR